MGMGNASNPDQASYKNMTPKEVAQSMYNNQRKPWRKKCCCLSTEYVLAFALLVWVGAGAFGAHTQWNLSYINSAYFAITALSTAGLHAPVDVGDWRLRVFRRPHVWPRARQHRLRHGESVYG